MQFFKIKFYRFTMNLSWMFRQLFHDLYAIAIENIVMIEEWCEKNTKKLDFLG